MSEGAFEADVGEEPELETGVDIPPGAFSAFNRGIIVGATYSIVILTAAIIGVAGGILPPIEPGGQTPMFATMGVLSGLVVAFGLRSKYDAEAIPTWRSASDTLMAAVWFGAYAFGLNFLVDFFPPAWLLGMTGLWVGAGLFGAVAAPFLGARAMEGDIKGVNPIRWSVEVTESIEDPDWRFMVRVFVVSIVAGGLALLASVAVVAALAVLVALAVMWGFLLVLPGDQETSNEETETSTDHA